MQLEGLFKWVLSGGAGVIAYALMEEIPFLATLQSKAKRYAALGIASALACLGFGAMVLFGYEAAPIDAQSWVEALFSAIAVAVGLSQIIHGERQLNDK